MEEVSQHDLGVRTKFLDGKEMKIKVRKINVLEIVNEKVKTNFQR